MDEKLDLTEYEKGVELLAEKLKFPPNPDGSEMPMPAKKMFLMQFLTFALMS